jgi:hypothetical protein
LNTHELRRSGRGLHGRQRHDPAAAKRLERRIVAFELRADNVEKIAQRIA